MPPRLHAFFRRPRIALTRRLCAFESDEQGLYMKLFKAADLSGDNRLDVLELRQLLYPPKEESPVHRKKRRSVPPGQGARHGWG